MSIHPMFVAIVVFAIGALSANGAEPTLINRVVNLAGWAIPGQDAIARRAPTSTRTADFEGIRVEISTFSGLPIWIDRQRRYLTNRVLLAFTSGPNSITIDERQLAVNEVTRYSVGHRPFLYAMLAYPCAADPKSKHGGCTGGDVQLAYYDEDGDGTFEVMEIVNPIVSKDTSLNWRPKLPSWAAAREH